MYLHPCRWCVWVACFICLYTYICLYIWCVWVACFLVFLSLCLTPGTATAGRKPPSILSPSNGEIVYCGRDGAAPTLTFSVGVLLPWAVDAHLDTLFEISLSRTFNASEGIVYNDCGSDLDRYSINLLYW